MEAEKRENQASVDKMEADKRRKEASVAKMQAEKIKRVATYVCIFIFMLFTMIGYTKVTSLYQGS